MEVLRLEDDPVSVLVDKLEKIVIAKEQAVKDGWLEMAARLRIEEQKIRAILMEQGK